jgi:hypothetical protein
MQAGLPVLASINPGNDLVSLIESNGVGSVCVDGASETLERLACALLGQVDDTMSARCTALHRRLFSPECAVTQIVAALDEVTAGIGLPKPTRHADRDDFRSSAAGTPELAHKAISNAAAVEQ